MIDAEGLLFLHDDENEFFKLLRFLRARKFNVEQAMIMVRNDCTWRRDVVGYDLILENAQDVLRCDLASVYKYFPTWLQGFDKQHRPVSYRQFGKFEIWQILQLTDFQSLVRFHAWESEMAIRQMFKKSQDLGINVETFVCVVDAQGWGVRLATKDAFAFIKSMADTDAAHYPERLGRLIVINAPFALSWAWSIIVTFLDEVTKAKISIYSSQATWQPVLFELIEKSQIPEMYGGDAPNPQGACAILDMNPPEKVGEVLRRPTGARVKVNTKNEGQEELALESSGGVKIAKVVDTKDFATQTEEKYFFIKEHHKDDHIIMVRETRRRFSLFGI